VDKEAALIAEKVSDIVADQKNYLGNPFRPDWSSPSTHLLYGYWVGATPDGRKAREQLNYGVDPLFGEASGGLGFRLLSNFKLPFEKFCGGYASHFGIDPKFFKAKDYEGKGEEFAKRVIIPLFFNEQIDCIKPFYLYVNVTTPETLRAVLAEPKKYAPNGVYIMRIHGTFVNFLDLSPAIQEDIIARLDLQSTSL
jgi:pyruvate-formate lyase